MTRGVSESLILLQISGVNPGDALHKTLYVHACDVFAVT